MKTVEIVYRYTDAGFDPAPRPDSPAAARERLELGNVDFAALIDRLSGQEGVARRVVEVDPRELGVRGGDAPAQRPFAAVLDCADARVPIELVFNQGPKLRVAGNVLGPDILGSLRYAIENLGGDLRLILVLGHSGCGAVDAAVDTFLRPGGYIDIAEHHDLRGIVDGLLVTVVAAERTLAAAHGPEATRRPGYRAALVEMSVLTNAALAAFSIRRELETAGVADAIAAVYGVYDIATRRVWGPVANDGARQGLAEPPRGLAAFRALGDAAARSARIRALLDG